MSYALVFVVANRAAGRVGLQPFLDALGSAWDEVAPRRRGLAPRWAVTVSLPPSHIEAARMLELGPEGIPQVLGEWICVITRNSGLHLLGRDDLLSSTGVSFIRNLWLRLERFHPSKKIGLWCALRSGSGWSPQLKLEDACIRPIEALKFPSNTIVVLNDSAPTMPVRQYGEKIELAMSVNLSSAAANELKETTPGKALDPHSLRGTIDLLTGDRLISFGSSDDSLSLLASLERLAKGVEQLRTAGTNMEVVLVGDVPGVWLIRNLKDMSHVQVVHGTERTAAVTTRALDSALKEAIAEFFAKVVDVLPLSHWSEDARATFDHLTIIWPELEALRVQ